jgi:hypothetical protein
VRKTVIYVILCLFTAALLTGCAAMAVSPTTGFLYTDVKAPGGITKIHHVDFHSTSILGIYAKYMVTVYGE